MHHALSQIKHTKNTIIENVSNLIASATIYKTDLKEPIWKPGITLKNKKTKKTLNNAIVWMKFVIYNIKSYMSQSVAFKFFCNFSVRDKKGLNKYKSWNKKLSNYYNLFIFV